VLRPAWELKLPFGCNKFAPFFHWQRPKEGVGFFSPLRTSLQAYRPGFGLVDEIDEKDDYEPRCQCPLNKNKSTALQFDHRSSSHFLPPHSLSHPQNEATFAEVTSGALPAPTTTTSGGGDVVDITTHPVNRATTVFLLTATCPSTTAGHGRALNYRPGPAPRRIL
jgi:hypothetical protein